MAKTLGLFTRQEIKVGADSKRATDLNQLAPESLWRIGLKGIKGMNPHAKHPEMQPHGPGESPLIYLLGGSPTIDDDDSGQPMTRGPAANRLGRALKAYEMESRGNFVVRTLPPANRAPSAAELECFRPSVIEDIEASKPHVIIGLGDLALEWALGSGVGGTYCCRGRRFPIHIGSHVCWFYPTYDPSEVLLFETEKNAKGKQDRDGPAKSKLFDRDIARACADSEMCISPSHIVDIKELHAGTEIITGHTSGDLERVKKWLAWANEQTRVFKDYETNCLRPYAPGAKRLSLAIGTQARAVAIALDHPGAGWDRPARTQLEGLLQTFFEGDLPKGAHNLAFDLEWTLFFHGPQALRACHWDCTQQQAFVIDHRQGGHSLNFCTLQYGGFQLKKQSNIDRKQLEQTDLKEVLKYNVLDVKYADLVFYQMLAVIKAEKQAEIYREMVRRVPTFVFAQHQGFPVNQGEVEVFAADYSKRLQAAENRVMLRDEVVSFVKKGGHFNPHSPDDVKTLFKEHLKLGPDKGKFSVDEAFLSEQGPLGKAIVAARKAKKAKGTYIDPLDRRAEGSVVYPDGLIHFQLNSMNTDTGRTSAEDPNVQNYPKRDPETKKIRRCFAVGPNDIIIATDYAQLEARVIGAKSGDKFLIKALWNNYDIHMAWAERIHREYPKVVQDRYGDLDEKVAMKSFRGDVKNEWVFPAFYGAQPPSIARSLDNMPKNLVTDLFREFWIEFEGVKAWQERSYARYKELGYVEGELGRRRYGPLNDNKIINTPVQGDASDIVVDAMNRLSEYGIEHEQPWLSARLNIHDDLTFIVPKCRGDAAIKIIVDKMLDCPWSWTFNIPLGVEVSVGQNWADMKEIGKFASEPG